GPHVADPGKYGLVAGAAAQQCAQIVTAGGEKAGVELTFGGDAGTGAVAAEGLGHRGDDADLAAAVLVTPAFGDFAGVIRVGGFQRQFAGDDVDDLSRADDVIHAPAVGGADVHVFDETQDVAAFAE